MDISVCICACLCVCLCMCAYTSWDHVRVAKQKLRKGQPGVGSQFSPGHRWRGGQNVWLRLGGYVEEGS